jgi:hypothetical protein
MTRAVLARVPKPCGYGSREAVAMDLYVASRKKSLMLKLSHYSIVMYFRTPALIRS